MKCYNEHGALWGAVTGFDSDEGWVEFYPIYPKVEGSTAHTVFDRKAQESVKVRVHTSYEIRHRQTNEVLYKVVWDMAGNKTSA